MEEFETNPCRACFGEGVIIFENGKWESCKQCAGFGFEPDFNKPLRRKDTMNYSTAVMLFNQDIRAVRVSYDPNDKVNGVVKSYLFKTLDPDLKVGDFVSIPTDTRHNITVAKVEEVDAEVDFDSTFEMKWIVSRVPVKEYEGILADEQVWIAEMKKAQNLKKKEDIKKSMLDMYQANGSSLETLAIAGRKPAPTCMIAEKEEE